MCSIVGYYNFAIIRNRSSDFGIDNFYKGYLSSKKSSYLENTHYSIHENSAIFGMIFNSMSKDLISSLDLTFDKKDNLL